MLLHFLSAKPSFRKKVAPQYRCKELLQLPPPPRKTFLNIWLLLKQSFSLSIPFDSQQSPSPSSSHTTEGHRQKLTLQKLQSCSHLLQSTQQGKHKRKQHHNDAPAAHPHSGITVPRQEAGLVGRLESLLRQQIQPWASWGTPLFLSTAPLATLVFLSPPPPVWAEYCYSDSDNIYYKEIIGEKIY